MQCMAEALGLALPGAALIPANHEGHPFMGPPGSRIIMKLAREDIRQAGYDG